MTHMHTYEFQCDCGNKINAELHKQYDETPICSFCHKQMAMTFYLRSPDTRATA